MKALRTKVGFNRRMLGVNAAFAAALMLATAGPAEAAETRLDASWYENVLCGNRPCGSWRHAFSERVTINSGSDSRPTEIGLNSGLSYARWQQGGFVPYAICITDRWVATGNSSQTFTGTAGLVDYSHNMGADMVPHVAGRTASLRYAGNRKCRTGGRVATPDPGNGRYYVQFSATRGHITSVRHTQTVRVYWYRSSWDRQQADRQHTISDTVRL